MFEHLSLLYRSDTVESVLCTSLLPTEFSVKDKVGHWVRVFSGFDKVEVKALERILEQKQRSVVKSLVLNLNTKQSYVGIGFYT